MSLFFNMLSSSVIAFLPRNEHLLISWLQSPTAVTLQPKKIKSLTVSIVSSSIFHEVIGPDAMIFVFWMLNYKPAFSLSSFTFIKRLFASSSLSAIRVVSSAYLRLLIFLLAMLIPACASSSQTFRMMYSIYKLNKQGDNVQPWRAPFPILNQSTLPCPVSTVLLDLHTGFSGGRQDGLIFPSLFHSLNFPQFVVIHTVKGFSVVNEAEIVEVVFLEYSCFSMIQQIVAIWSLVPLQLCTCVETHWTVLLR